MGNTVMKRNAKKIRRMYNDKMLAGFAGTTADALTLFEKFEGKLEKYRGNVTRAGVELAKDWRSMTRRIREARQKGRIMYQRTQMKIGGLYVNSKRRSH